MGCFLVGPKPFWTFNLLLIHNTLFNYIAYASSINWDVLIFSLEDDFPLFLCHTDVGKCAHGNIFGLSHILNVIQLLIHLFLGLLADFLHALQLAVQPRQISPDFAARRLERATTLNFVQSFEQLPKLKFWTLTLSRLRHRNNLSSLTGFVGCEDSTASPDLFLTGLLGVPIVLSNFHVQELVLELFLI